MSDKKYTALRPAGHIIVTYDDGKIIEGDTMQCCHCGIHWRIVFGSGRKRGTCTRCNKPTCGRPSCDPCRPIEARLDFAEKQQELIVKG